MLMLVPVQSGRASPWTQPSLWWFRPGPTPSARLVRAVQLRSSSLHSLTVPLLWCVSLLPCSHDSQDLLQWLRWTSALCMQRIPWTSGGRSTSVSSLRRWVLNSELTASSPSAGWTTVESLQKRLKTLLNYCSLSLLLLLLLSGRTKHLEEKNRVFFFFYT